MRPFIFSEFLLQNRSNVDFHASNFPQLENLAQMMWISNKKDEIIFVKGYR
jgi:hypothetical protein